MKAVREMDHDGLLLCRIQAETFELSVEKAGTSSEIFIRRFMKSEAAQLLDSGAILYRMYEPQDLPDDIEEQYGASTYGSVKFSRDEMHWIGYLYRYFSYTYRLSSQQVYRIVKGKELRDVYLPYHSLDPGHAIERILEAKHYPLDDEGEMRRQLEIMKRIRMAGEAAQVHEETEEKKRYR